MKFPWFRRRQEIDEEIQTHIQMAIRDRIEGGESPAEARRNAHREFGNEYSIHERTRDIWGWVSLEQWTRDLRYVCRQIVRNPGFAAVAIITLAVGIGAITAMFSIVDSVLLEPLKYSEPGRLYSVVNLPPPNTPNRYWLINGRHYAEWRAHCRTCQDISMAEGNGFTVTGLGEPERFTGLRVSYNFFRTLGVQPAIGRDFLPEEELPGRFHELILSDAFWRSRFSGDPAILGRTLEINGEPFVVIGVMPANFQLPVGTQWGPGLGPAIQPVMFRPLGQDFSQAWPAGTNNYVSVVRLKPGVTPAETAAELNSLIADFVREFHIELVPTLLPLKDTMVREARTGLLLLLGIVIAVLLIVCFNVGNLMLVRIAGRGREVGIRMALGSSRLQLFFLVLNEALVLVTVGSCLGLILAFAALKAFSVVAPVDLPRVAEVHMGWRVCLFTIAAAAGSILICGLLPAWRLARIDPQESLKAGSPNSTAQGQKLRFHKLIAGVEVALSTVLLIIGSLLVLSFIRVLSGPKGFDAEHVISQDVALIGTKYKDPDRIRFVDEALRQFAAIPGVLSVGVTNQIPLRGETWLCDLRDPGPPAKKSVAVANFRFVSPAYWETLGIPIKKGRRIEASDRNRGVAVLSERAAELLWPGQDPIGKRVGACGGELVPPGVEVVGIVGEVRAGMEREAPLTVYQPYWTVSNGRFFFVLRTEAEPVAINGEVRRVLRSMDESLPIPQTTTMQQVQDDAVAGRRFQMNLTVAFAISALLLASLGIYGVLSFSVARRTPELGIRLALGARDSQLAKMVVKQGMIPVVAGLAAGLVFALVANRLIASQLYEVTSTDPLTISAVAVVVLIAGIFACWIPARRAMRIDTLTALRFD